MIVETVTIKLQGSFKRDGLGSKTLMSLLQRECEIDSPLMKKVGDNTLSDGEALCTGNVDCPKTILG